ncbi:uncharacterized protein LOC116429086 isoform X1 [Nomia melanderi]|uniref:uncharacterized protein LOC116429086 isoform X1 n=1 Tax=Nomia melanderi TaxID=2448451 RepID=UPI0013044161|nr:uncharacterized protein LOC116429086 isoform X1 [Nomia melanderi]
MKTRMCFLCCSTFHCLVFFNVFVTAVNPVTFINEDFREKLKLFVENVPVNQKIRGSSLELQSDELDWIVPATSSKVPRFIDTSKDIFEGTILHSTNKCTRYCIGNGTNLNENNVQYINIFWSNNGIEAWDNSVSKDHLELITPEVEWTDEHILNNIPRKCQVYLDLDCNTAEAGTGAISIKQEFLSNVPNSERNEDSPNKSNKPTFQTPVNIAERCNLSNHTETKFFVDNAVDRIVINVEGNVSNAILRIPMSVTVPWPETVVSWTRRGETDGVRIDTINAPSGEWRIQLTGVDNSNYHFIAEGFARSKDVIGEELLHSERQPNGTFNIPPFTRQRLNIKRDDSIKLEKDKSLNDSTKMLYSEVIRLEEQSSNVRVDSKLVNDEKVTRERSLKHTLLTQEDTDEISLENFNDNDSPQSSNIRSMHINYIEHVTFPDNDQNVSDSMNNLSESFDEKISAEKQQEIRTRSSIALNENVDTDIRMAAVHNASMPMKMAETLDNGELFKESVTYGNGNTIEEKKMLIDVNRNSNLIAVPGTIHRIVFDVMNNCVLPVRYGFRVRSTPFRVYNLQPAYAWIYPGQMSSIAVDIVIPDNTSPDTANTVTLFIQGTEIKEKSAYIYVQGSLSKLTDDVKPKIEYSFNNNCAGKLDKNHCYKSRWSVDISIQDYDSGLKRVISSSNDVYPRTEFISGTRSLVTFFYSATCCDTTTKITAIDLLDNYNTITIDVTEWNNLSEAQIAAIAVGALLALLLIIFIIILIIYCIRRRKSLDLPYTQRYGSRPPVNTEGTTF